ncbi:MAG: plasmid mobilization relaxosome protein MobC [Lachnospiraceae bacterium]|nr:plasmid mobilization relaxosome protein MobC [Lachnospiraceae bacterium]
MEKRDVQMNFRVTKGDAKIISQKMKQAGIHSPGAYLRKMAMDGYCIQLDLSDVKELIKLLRVTSNNLNQYVKKAHETGSIYQEDLDDLQKRQEEIWKQMKIILVKLSNIR